MKDAVRIENIDLHRTLTAGVRPRVITTRANVGGVLMLPLFLTDLICSSQSPLERGMVIYLLQMSKLGHREVI